MTRIIKNNMYLVGNLQDFGKPYASLFIDKDVNGLYIFIKTKDAAKAQYIVSRVTCEDVMQYLNGQIGLNQFFTKQALTASINNGIVEFQQTCPSKMLNDNIEHEDIFDPEFCYDKLKLNVFLRRYRKELEYTV